MKEVVPPQHTGAESNTTHTITTNTIEEAKSLFNKARKNLLNINSWEHLAGKLSASFQLTDEQGNPLYRSPQLGDFIMIDIPAPDNESGEGCDWVRIEEMEEQLEDETINYIAIRVRPATAPVGHEDAKAHFFTEDATSTFYVERNGLTVMAAVFGRNEKPNTEPEGLLNKVRNVVIAGMAMMGFNKPQWKALVTGVLEKDADAITFQE